MGLNSRNIQVRSAENGLPTATFHLPEGREIYLHSRFDPAAEARFLIEKIPVKAQTLYVILGFGLGYHVKALLDRIPSSSHILVVEPVTEHLSAQALAYYQEKNESWIQDDRLSFHTHYDPETVPIFLAEAFIRCRVLSLNIFMHIPSASTNEAFYSWLLKEVQQKFPVYLDGHLGANDRTLENNLSNFWANLPITWQTPHISCLKRGWQGYPVIIVAAGPSLTDELNRLRDIQERVLIICVGTAAPVMMKYGVHPDFVVSVDPFEANMSHFENWNNGKIPLIYYHRFWRGILPVYNGPRFWFAMDDEPAIPLTGIKPTTEFWRGGTVSFTALQVAHYLKADPIVLVGLDFAYLDGRMHAEGAVNETYKQAESLPLPEGFFRIPGISGDQVVTNLNYYSYLLYIQDYIQRHPQTRHINTSPTGAKIHGTIEMSLKQTVEAYNEFKEVIGKQIAYENVQPFEPVTWDNIFDLAGQWEKELSIFINDNEAVNKLDKLVSRFRRLSVYRVISGAYDNCFHSWEIKKLKNQVEPENALCKRLKAHCRFVQNRLREFLYDDKTTATLTNEVIR